MATINPDGSLGPISTYFRLNRTTLETKYGLRDIPDGKDVFEQYFENAVNDMAGPVFK